jgi:hypothetical protein
MDMLLVAALITGAVALAMAPLLLPWPWEVRWIVAADAVNPLVALSNARRHIHLEEVVLVGFDSNAAALVVVVNAERTQTPGGTELVGPPCSTADLAALDGWYSVQTPLLLVDANGISTLKGPRRSITGLHEPHYQAPPTLA